MTQQSAVLFIKLIEIFFDGKSLLCFDIENRQDAKRLLEIFKEYTSENEWIEIYKGEIKIIEKEIVKK